MSLTNILIGLTVIISFLAFNNYNLRSTLIDNPYSVARKNEYYRLLTSGFIHADFMHLFFNMFVLYSFGNNMETLLEMYFAGNGKFYFIGLYLIGIIISSIPSQIRHRNDPAYNSLGASGGVSSVLFAFIMLLPTSTLMIFPIPVQIPAWVFGILYIIYSVYMDRRQADNVNHLAHMWGALWGVVFVILLFPDALERFVLKIMGTF